jgi:hypothetical protein
VYRADFVYKKNQPCLGIPDNTVTVVEDVKSDATRKKDEYCIKRKLMRDRKGIQIREV